MLQLLFAFLLIHACVADPFVSVFEFNPACDQFSSGLFQLQLAGNEKHCAFVVTENSISEFELKFKVSSFDALDADADANVDVAGLCRDKTKYFFYFFHQLFIIVVSIDRHLQLIVFGPGKEEGLRFGNVDVPGDADEPYASNTKFLPWDESSTLDGVNYRTISLPKSYQFVGGGPFKVSSLLINMK